MADLGPTLTDRDTEVLGDAFGEVARDGPLGCRRDVAGPRPRYGRKRHLIRDARIVGRQGGRKKSSANETVGRGFGKG